MHYQSPIARSRSNEFKHFADMDFVCILLDRRAFIQESPPSPAHKMKPGGIDSKFNVDFESFTRRPKKRVWG